MTVTGVEWCDFFIWLDDEVHQETIEFDWFCNMIKDKLDMFYLNNFLWSFTCNNNMEKVIKFFDSLMVLWTRLKC